MAKHRRASIREALEAATGGTGAGAARAEESGNPIAETATGDQAEETVGGENMATSPMEGADETLDDITATRKRRGRPRKSQDATGGDVRRRGRPRKEEGHRKTSTGYMTSAGQQIVRLTLHLTPEQKRNLKIKSLEAGYENASAYLIEKLEL